MKVTVKEKDPDEVLAGTLCNREMGIVTRVDTSAGVLYYTKPGDLVIGLDSGNFYLPMVAGSLHKSNQHVFCRKLKTGERVIIEF